MSLSTLRAFICFFLLTAQMSLGGIIGEESRRILMPEHSFWELAYSIGSVDFCGNDAGSVTLVEYQGQNFIIGAAHGFYNEDGSLICDGNPTVYFDLHTVFWDSTQNVGLPLLNEVDPFLGFAIEMPPINHRKASTWANRSMVGQNKLDRHSIFDFVIFHIQDSDKLLVRQTGEPRTPFFITRASEEDFLIGIGDINLISIHDNFHNSLTTAVETGCEIRSTTYFDMWLSSCDSGGGSSGSALFQRKDAQSVIVGVVQGDTESDTTSLDEYFSGLAGTLLIPSTTIIDQLEELSF